MKNIITCLSLLAITMVSFKPAGELAIGESIPKNDLKLKDVSGNEVTLQSQFGQHGLVVMFTCNTCPYVIKNQARTKEVCAYAAKSGMGVVLLNSNEASRDSDDSMEAMKAYAQEQGYSWIYAADPANQIADAFGANRTPECYLFNKDGKLVYHGAIDDSPADATAVKRNHLKEAVTELNQGKDITVKTSRSVGCSIKRKA